MSLKTRSTVETINLTSIICGIAFSVIRAFEVSIAGSPYDMIHKLDGNGIIPPVWVLNLIGEIVFFFMGYAAGIILNELTLCRASLEKRALAYKGGVFFVFAFFLTLRHYTLFFICEKLLVSLIISLLTIVFSVLCAFTWSKISAISAFLCSIHSLYSACIFLINLLIFIAN